MSPQVLALTKFEKFQRACGRTHLEKNKMQLPVGIHSVILKILQ